MIWSRSIVGVIIGLVLTFRNGGKGQFAGDRRQLRKALILGAMFAGIYLGIYIQSLVFTPAFIPRYLSWVSVPFFMAVAALFTVAATSCAVDERPSGLRRCSF